MGWGAGAVAGALGDLWPVLAGLTALEGATLVGRRSRLATALVGSPLRLRGPGLRWTALGPLDRAYTIHPELAVLGPERVHFLVAREVGGARRFRPDHHHTFAYGDLEELGRGLDPAAERLTLPDGTTLALPSAAEGRALVERISRLAALTPVKRRKALAEAARDRLDEAELDRRRAGLGHPWPVLRTLAATAFFWNLLLVPAVVYKPGVPVALAWPLAAGFLALHAATAAAAVLTARRLRSNGLAVARGTLVGVCLYPPATLRAATTLAKELAAGLDPLALLATEGAREELAAPLRAELHGIEQALGDPGGDGDWRAAWEIRRGALEGFLARLGTSRPVAQAPPEREDPAASHFCPFCESEFQSGTAECPDCLARLVPFEGGEVVRPI